MVVRLATVVVVLMVSVSCSEASSPAGPRASPPATTSQSPSGEALSATERAVLDDVVAFALAPSEVAARRIPFAAGGIRIGLGQRLVDTVGASELARPSAWTIEGDFGGVMGPFSALESIARHADGRDLDPALRTNGELMLMAGPHTRCASPAADPPAGLRPMRQLSIQPADGSITSCLGWFAVDLYVAKSGRVRAVTLDLWDP